MNLTRFWARFSVFMIAVFGAFAVWAEGEPVGCSYDDVPRSVLPGTAATFSVVSAPDDGELVWTWSFGDGGSESTSARTVDHVYGAVGQYAVSVTASAASGEPVEYAFSNRVVCIQRDIYVSPSGGSAEFPYDAPARALDKIATALSVAADGCVIHLAAGTYEKDKASNVTVDKAVTVIGEGAAPADVVIPGYASNTGSRNLQVRNAGAFVGNLTLYGGFAGSAPGGGNLYLEAGTVSNCVLSSGRTRNSGADCGGARVAGGLLTHCVITNSYQGNRGNGIALSQSGGRVSNCLITKNWRSWDSSRNAFSLVYVSGGIIDNCTIADCWIVRNNPDYKMQMGSNDDKAVNVGSGAKAYNLAIADIRYDRYDVAQGKFVEYTAEKARRWAGTAASFVNCRTDDDEPINGTCATASVDEMFINYAVRDLSPASALLDAGAGIPEVGFPPVDLAGAKRVSGAGIDIGAYELPQDFRVRATAAKHIGVLPDSTEIPFSAEPFYAAGDVTYTWDFGDGSEPYETSETTAAHVYSSVGEYSVTVVGSDGETESTFTLPQKIVITALDCDFRVSAQAVTRGRALVFSAENLVASGAVTFTWDFGDGTPPVETSETSVEHTYAALGAYQVSVRMVSQADGTLDYVFPDPIGVRSPLVYVDIRSTAPAAPYDTPETAFGDLFSALGYAVDGCTLIVRPGVYPEKNQTYTVTNAVRVIGETGNPYDVCLSNACNRGSGWRNLLVDNPGAVVANVELAWGYGSGSKGGNLYLGAGMVSNCVLTSGQTYNSGEDGGGAYVLDGVLTHCVITNAMLTRRGDGIFLRQEGGRVSNCLFTHNRRNTDNSHNAAHLVRVSAGALENCTLVGGLLRKVGTGGNTEVGGNVDRGVYCGPKARVVNLVMSDVAFFDADDEPIRYSGTTGNFVNCASEDAEAPNGTCVVGTADEFFAAPGDGDYAPRFGGRLHNAGSADVTAEPTDLSGAVRVLGRAVDIGCYECRSRPLSVYVR